MSYWRGMQNGFSKVVAGFLIGVVSVGGFAVANMLVNEVLKHGARIANPGEFSKRAFFNNKIDLTKETQLLKIH